MNHYECLHYRRPRRPRLGRLAALVCLAGLGLNARAYDAGVRSEYTANQVLNEARYFDKSWSVTNGSDGSAKLGRNFTMRAPGGREIATRALATVDYRATLGIAARVLGRAVLPIAIGLTIWDVYNAVGVRPDGNGGLNADPGQSSQLVLGWSCTFGNWSGYGESANLACAAAAALYALNMDSNSPPAAGCIQHRRYTYEGRQSNGRYAIRYTYSYSHAVGQTCQTTTGGSNLSVWTDAFSSEIERCPAYTDSLGQAHTAGEPKRADGVCPTGTYNPIEVAAAEEKLRGAYDNGQIQVDMAKMWDDVLNRSPEGVEVPAAGMTMEVPEVAPLAGPVTTTSNSDGTTRQDAIGWNFERIADNLGNKKDFKVTETKTTTVKDAAGNVISESSTGTSGQTAGDIDKSCDLDPGKLGCIGLGEAPTDAVPKSTRNLTWSQESLSFPSSCPADRAVGAGLVVSYAETCKAATQAKPFILAGAAFASLLIVLAALRGN